MSKLCQGPSCHMYDTTDRKRGPKGNKRNQTRTVGSYVFGDGNFCDMRCQNDWFYKYGTQAVNHFGRRTQAKHLTEHNAWTKDYDYNWRNDNNPKSNYRFVNKITKERRSLTEVQYNDSNYTLNTGE